MNNGKLYNTFVFIGTFARSLIEVFVPIVLYNRGLNIESIFFFLLITYSFSFILNFPLAYLSKKITFKWLIVISSISIIISYYFLFLMPLTSVSIVIIALTHVFNAHIYWLSRHYFALEILNENKMGTQVGSIVIFSQMAIIPASYIGALLITYLKFEYVLMIIVMLYIISIIPLFKIKESGRKKLTINDGLLEIVDTIPRRSVCFYIFAQFRNISKYIFPLYIYIYVRNNYQFIGIFNISVGIASMIFVYLFARKMDKEKEDYLILSGILSLVVWILKLNVFSTFLMLAVGLMEGLVEKMYEAAFNRNMYALGKKYSSLAYASFVEGLQSFFRIVIILLAIVFVLDLRMFLYVCAFMVLFTGLIGFDDGEGGY